MKVRFLPVLPGILLLLTVGLEHGRAEVSEAQLRAAIIGGLGFVTKQGDVWMEEKNCNSCHHLPEMLWNYQEARRRGVAVSAAKFDEWLAWAEPKVKNISAGLEGVAFMTLALADKPPAAADALRLILAGQEADGSWKPAGQLSGMQKRSADEAREMATRLHLLALDVLDSKGAATLAARTKAAKWVAKTDPPSSVETLVYRARFARRFGTQAEAAALRDALLELQHPDGGWAWSVSEVTSDPLATGQVLHLLREDGDSDATAVATAKAQEWLVKMQRNDGAWPIDPMLISKTDRSGEKKAGSLKNVTEIYEFWGTAWATLGLLQGLPVVQEHLPNVSSSPEQAAP